MKKKKQYTILITLLITMMISITFVSASSTNIKNPNSVGTSAYEDVAELPEWSLDDYWLYDMNFDFTLVGSFSIVGAIKDMELIVSDVDEIDDEYTVSINGILDATLELFGSSGGSIKGFITGEAHFVKSTLAIKDFEFDADGKFNYLEMKAVTTMTFDPAFDFFAFPIKSTDPPWNADTTGSISGNLELGTANIPFSVEGPFEDEVISFVAREDVTVPAGTFDSFKISGSLGNPSELWYSPDAGYLVKIHEVIDEWSGVTATLDMPLKATTFNNDNHRPDKPSKPTGPLKGATGVEHTYNATATDPDGDEIYYKFYWGDGTFSSWVGPYPSGNEGSASHKWTKQGSYEIKVKVKDEHDVQSEWSDPLSVTMPRNRAITSPFLKFLQNYPNLFPILRLLLQRLGL